ncbi:MAG TPA: GTPase HflX [Thermomicrobiales bacterium]|nr:GTPase HflX [Thermomicrobiales bacterium]
MLVAVERPGQDWAAADSLEELARLAETVDVDVVGAVTQKLSHPLAGTYVGKGKLQEIKARRDDLEYDVVMVDDDLSPAQQRNLEKELDVKIIDRTALILDVFARRAATHEGRLQVELAQLEYRLPRLTGLWTHLSRQGVGGVGLRGPGETQLESDRRELGKRIVQLKRELGEVHRHRQLYRERRKGAPIPVAALVGYTNAGKSTLLNALTGAGVMAEDKLFATLDPTTRRVRLPSGREALTTDTVGFINNLPTLLIAAFRATLEEINEASVLIHVVDVTHPNAPEQIRTVLKVLEELGADDKPVITALNKVDRLLPEDGSDGGNDMPDLAGLLARLGDAAELAVNPVAISAARGWGLEHLLGAVEAALEREDDFVPVRLGVPFARAELIDRFYRNGRVVERRDDDWGTTLIGVLPAGAVGQFGDFIAVEPERHRARPAPEAPLAEPVA